MSEFIVSWLGKAKTKKALTAVLTDIALSQAKFSRLARAVSLAWGDKR